MRLTSLAMTLLLAACSGGSPIQPGMWETTTRLSAGKSELWTSKMTRCIIEPETGDPATGILSATPLGHCQPTGANYGGGAMAVEAQCMGRSMPMTPGMESSKVALSGRYTPTSIDGRFTANLVFEPGAPALEGTLTARRTGNCPT